MDPKLTALLANSANITQLVPDTKLMAQVYLRATLFRVPNDRDSLATVPDGLSTLSPDQQVNVEIYQIAKRLGLPTDGRALADYIFSSVGGLPTPPSPSSDLPTLLLNVWLKYLKAY